MQVGTQITPDGFKDLGAFHLPHWPLLWAQMVLMPPYLSPLSEAPLPAQIAERRKGLRPRNRGSPQATALGLERGE